MVNESPGLGFGEPCMSQPAKRITIRLVGRGGKLGRTRHYVVADADLTPPRGMPLKVGDHCWSLGQNWRVTKIEDTEILAQITFPKSHQGRVIS